MSPEIIIVDDDEAVRDSLQLLLSTANYQVRVFASGTAFLDVFKTVEAGCVLLDIILGDTNGLEVLEQVVEHKSDLPVIMMTGHGDIPMAVRAMKAGATDFVEKPYSEELIISAIQRALDRGEKARNKGAQADEVDERVAILTPRERDVLEHLVIGRPNKIIAYELGISPRTVEIHRARVMEKMQAESLSHLVRMALMAELVPEASP